jgi:hypothetical protein
MRGNNPFLIAGSVLLVAVMILAGCVQNNGISTQTTGGQPMSSAASSSLANGTRFHPNLSAAAAKLGVAQEQLENVLNTTFQGRMNLTYAAQQLGVTTQQLADALGFRFNASRQRPGPGTTPQ